MIRKGRFILLFIGLLFVIGIGTGCHKKIATIKDTQGIIEEERVTPEPQTSKEIRGTEEELRVEAPQQRTTIGEEEMAERGREMSSFFDIYFDFDRSIIREDAKSALEKNARILASNPNIKIQIEGHCDERGTDEYNLALGERRARAAKRYLIALGISKDRIITISYGEERPICSGHNEDCWWQNRRAHLLSVE